MRTVSSHFSMRKWLATSLLAGTTLQLRTRLVGVMSRRVVVVLNSSTA